MENIEIKVTKTNISITNGYVLNQGEYQVDKCKFTFSDEYAGLVKKAIFVDGSTSIDMVILNDECNIPYEILQNSNEFTLKVYGYQVQNEELVVRYSPTALKIFLREGSYVGSNEVITPSQFEQYEQALHDGLDDLSEAMETMETTVNAKLDEVDEALEDVETATTEANNLNLDVSKSGKVATVTLTKKDASIKVVTLSDGTSLMFNWDGTKLGIKTDEDEQYTYVDLQGVRGETGLTPNIQIGTVVSGSTPSVTRTGTNENPVLNFTLVKGDKGDTGNTGETGEDGNGIVGIEKTATSGLVDTYTITYTNGTTTTFNVTNGEDGEVTQTQLDETNKRVALNSKLRNALPKVTGTGTELTLNDTAESEMVLSLSGNTEQRTTTGSNLLETKNISRTISGVTFTVNEDGSITIDGTATADAQLFINTENNASARTVPLKGSTSYIFNGKNDDNILVQAWYSKNNVAVYALNKFVTEEETFLGAYIKIQSGKTINNYTIYPQLAEGTELPEWEPYTGGIASPNPDYPQDIVNVTGDNEVRIANRNKFDGQWELGSIHGTTGANIDDPLVIRSVNYLPVKSGKTYVINAENNATIFVHFYDENKNHLTLNSAQNTPKIITIPSNAYYVRLRTRQTEKITSLSFKCQLEEGTIPTSYVKHKKQIFPITLGNIEVCKNDNYKDFFFKNIPECEYYDSTLSLNKWYLKKVWDKHIFTGNENIGSITNSYYIQKPTWLNSTTLHLPCTHTNRKIAYSCQKTDVLYLKKKTFSGFETITDFKNWLAEQYTNGTAVIVLGVLATPENILLNDTLQTQLDNIMYAYAYQDQTHITQENDGTPFNIDAEAVRDMTNIFDLITTNTTQGTEL